MDRFSISKIIQYMTCPRAFEYIYLHHFELKKSDNMFFGSAVHEGLAAHFRGEDPIKKFIHFSKSQGWQKPKGYDEEKNLKSGIAILEAYQKKGIYFEPNLEWIEQRKTIQLTNPLSGEKIAKPFTFMIDLITRDGYIVDHKAQPLESNVLTPTGYKRFGSLEVGSEVIGYNGKSIRVIGIFPQGSLDTYKITFSDRTTTECSEDHLWTMRDPRDKEWRTVPLKTIMIRKEKYRKIFIFPYVHAVNFKNTFIPKIHPYILGALLGDGYFAGHSGVQYSGSQKLKGDCIENIKNFLPQDMMIKRSGSMNYTWIITNKEKRGKNIIRNELMRTGLWEKRSKDKFIPEEYKMLPIKKRILLLQGLLDTDGNSYHGNVTYSSTSKQLCEDIVFIVNSLGGSARYRERAWSPGNKNQPYIVCIRLPFDIKPFLMKRKMKDIKKYPKINLPHRHIESIELIGKKDMQCISVDANDGLYITDNFIVTHNTASSGHGEQNETNKIQGIAYTMAYRSIFGKKPRGFIQNTIVKLKTPRFIAKVFKYTDDEELYVFNMIKHVLERVEKRGYLVDKPSIKTFYPCPIGVLCDIHRKKI